MKKLGLTSTHVNLCKLAIGMGRPGMYWEFGLQNNALVGADIPEKTFRPYFLDACNKGLLVWADDGQGRIEFKLRKYVITDRGWMVVVDDALLENKSAEDYHYYKTFDGTESGLKRVQKSSNDVEVHFKGRKKGISIKELFRTAPKSAQDKIKAANPKWKSMLT
jgi:hypothetical protein